MSLTRNYSLKFLGRNNSERNTLVAAKGLLSANHRMQMISLALQGNSWVQQSNWEAEKGEWTPTFDVLNYHHGILQQQDASTIVWSSLSTQLLPPISFNRDIPPRLMFLCGGDIVESFNVPNLWREDHVTTTKHYLTPSLHHFVKKLFNEQRQIIQRCATSSPSSGWS